MVIHIGIIGTKEVIEQIRQVIKMFPTFVPQFHVVEQERDIPDIAQIISSEVEVILLSGQVTSRKVKEKLTLPIPVHFVPITEAGLYKAILSAVLLNNLEHGISVDSLTKVTVSRAMKELGFNDIPYTVYNGPAYSSTDRIVSFHKEQFEEGRCSIIFTGIQAVRDQLAELNIPNVLFSPSDQDIIVALERALLSTESRRNKEAQVVVGIINVDDFSKLVLSKPNEHEVQRLKLDIHRMLLKYVETLDGHLTALSGDEYLFFTTRGILNVKQVVIKLFHLQRI